MKTTLLTLAISSIFYTAGAATFIPAEIDGKILIKTDQLPLDTNTMQWLSAHLTDLARLQSGSDAERLRASSKMLAIAAQLDRTNQRIPATISSLKSNKRVGPSSDMENRNKRLRKIIAYLDSSHSEQAKLLSSLTKDALAPIVPKKSPIANYMAPQEKWQGCIAPLQSFTSTSKPTRVHNDSAQKMSLEDIDDLPDHHIDQGKNDNDKPREKTTHEKGDAVWKKSTISFKVPMITTQLVGDKNKPKYSKSIGPVTIKLKPVSDDRKQRLELSSLPIIKEDHLKDMHWSIYGPLASQWNNITSADIDIKLLHAFSHQSDKNLIASSIVLALDADLRGQKLRPNLLTIAKIDSKGHLGRSSKFWPTLKYISTEAEDKRILVGSGTTESLMQMLSMGNPEFFIRNEVIQVKTISQARHYTTKIDDPSIAEATSLFAEVKSAIERKSLRSMTANKFVREKLEKVVAIMPNHISAVALLEYGSRKKDVPIDSKFFGYEIKSLLSAINHKLTSQDASISADHAIAENKKIDDGLDILRKFVSKEDRKVFDKVSKISGQLRVYARSKKKSDETKNPYFDKATKRNLSELKALNKALQVDIARLTETVAKKDK